MAPYFWILSIPCILAVFHCKRVNVSVLVLVFLFFVGFVGLRYRVGMDWNNYQYIHNWILDKSFYEVLVRSEPLSFALFWISSYLDQGSLISNIVAAMLLLFGVFAFSLRTQNPWLAIVAATPYLIIAFGMTGIRQAMAIGITLFMFSRWKKMGLVGRGALIGLASLFHTSAISLAVIFITDNSISLSRRIALGVVMLPTTYFAAFNSQTFSRSVEFYQEVYLGSGGGEVVISPGALLHISLILGPALGFLALRNKMREQVYDYNLLMFGSLVALAMIPIFLVSTSAASRLSLYVYFVPMMVYPAFVATFSRRHKLFITLVVCMMHFAILVAWILYANNSHAHIPYQNVMFDLG